MIKFVSYTNVNPTVEPASNVQGFKFRKIIRQPEDDVSVETLPEEDVLAEVLPEVITRPTTRRSSIYTSSLLSTDIEDIFRQAGLTTINGKKIKFGNKALRAQNASFGAKNSNHKKRDPYTGNAMARDISIIGGNLNDYAEFRRQIMSNDLISKYMDIKGWGIINEVTPQILARTGGTGPHFHFGPDTWARRTWQAWKNNPNAPITQAFKKGGQIQKCHLGDIIQKGFAYVFNGQDGTFNQAFNNAKRQGQRYFRWNGKLYNTSVKTNTGIKTIAQPAQKLDIYHKFKSRDFDEFVNVMYPIFEAAFKKYNIPTTQIQNVLRQSAYESAYGTSPRGAQGYNFGGIKWENNPKSRTYKYKHTTYPDDGLEYVDFDNLQDYADYKVFLLNDTYHALDAPTTDEFVSRLHGKNPAKKSYSANPNGYRDTLNGMKSFDKAYNNYMTKRK